MIERGDQQKRSTSILNDVIGPVMRGPSSSHTAGSLRIGRLARALLDDELAKVTFVFDPDGSLAQVYRQQGSDLAFAAGVVGLSLTDERFDRALDIAAEQGLEVAFVVEPLPGADHPNTVQVRLASRNGVQLCVTAASIGGGAVVLTRLAGWPVCLTGDAFEVLVVSVVGVESQVQEILVRDGKVLGSPTFVARDGQVLLHVRRQSPLSGRSQAEMEALPGVLSVWTAPPVLFVQRGAPLFTSAADMVRLAEERNCSLGQITLAYEATLLGIPESEVLDEVVHRFEVMRTSVHRGLEADPPPMRLLQPSAHQVYQAEAQGRVAVGGIHTRAAARALAVMHVNGGMGVVCAAPTGGSAAKRI